jgi:TM2 domain-containing membrane protein YozV
MTVIPDLPGEALDLTVVETESIPDRQRALINLLDGEIPLARFGNVEIPVFVPLGMDVWAVANLFISVLGAVLALFTAIKALFGKNNGREDQKAEEASENDPKNDGEQKKKKRRFIWFVTSIVAGIAGVAVFLLTENMNNPMVLVDMWTIVNLAIFVVEAVAIKLTTKKRKDKEDDDPDSGDKAPIPAEAV